MRPEGRDRTQLTIRGAQNVSPSPLAGRLTPPCVNLRLERAPQPSDNSTLRKFIQSLLIDPNPKTPQSRLKSHVKVSFCRDAGARLLRQDQIDSKLPKVFSPEYVMYRNLYSGGGTMSARSPTLPKRGGGATRNKRGAYPSSSLCSS